MLIKLFIILNLRDNKTPLLLLYENRCLCFKTHWVQENRSSTHVQTMGGESIEQLVYETLPDDIR